MIIVLEMMLNVSVSFEPNDEKNFQGNDNNFFSHLSRVKLFRLVTVFFNFKNKIWFIFTQ